MDHPDRRTPAHEGEVRTRPVGGTALLLMGGGARAAYSVGFLRCLGRHFPDGSDIHVLAGVSAGAINAAYLASAPGSFEERAEGLAELWSDLHPSRVMEVGSLDLLENVVLWGLQLLGGGSRILPTPRGLVDCRPLRRLLERELSAEGGALGGIEERLAEGGLTSVLLASSSYTTGEAVVWSQGRPLPESWARPGRRSEPTCLTLDHVMASAALPLLFPAVQLGDEWHGDGDIRLTSPLSPLVELGVDRILAVSTRCPRSSPDGPLLRGYPSPDQVAGTVLNTVALHHLESDERKLLRVNRLLEAGGAGATRDGSEGRPYRRVEILVLRPSRDLGTLAGEHEPELPWALRHMVRGLGPHGTASPGMLGMISFQPEYLSALLEMGEADAEERAGEVEAFLSSAAT